MYSANLGTKHAMAAVNSAVTTLMRGQQTSDGARGLLPPSLVLLHCVFAFGWVQLTTDILLSTYLSLAQCRGAGAMFPDLWTATEAKDIPEQGYVHDLSGTPDCTLKLC